MNVLKAGATLKAGSAREIGHSNNRSALTADTQSLLRFSIQPHYNTRVTTSMAIAGHTKIEKTEQKTIIHMENGDNDHVTSQVCDRIKSSLDKQ